MSVSIFRCLLIAFLSPILLVGCGGSSSGSSNNSEGTADASKISGTSQKGPFMTGSLVRADEVSASGEMVAGSTSTETTNDRGDFSFNDLSWSNPTRLRIDGLFFDEVSATVSSEQRQLDAVVAANKVNSANINLYTHMIAGRILSLMGGGEDFASAQSQAQADWQAVTGISTPAYQLDLLNGSSGDKETDSASLLLFSAAVLKEGLSQADIDTVQADFSDDGLINGSGQTIYGNIQEAASASLLDDARTNLATKFSTEPPKVVDLGDIAWKPDACTLAAINGERVLCGDTPFKGSYEHDNKEFVTFIPTVTGLYVISLDGDSSKDNPNAKSCYWGRYDEPDTSSPRRSTSPNSINCHSEAVGGRPYKGSKSYFLPTIERQSGVGQAWFQLSAHRIADGTTIRPVELSLNEPIQGVVGKLINSHDESYYTFIAGQGTHTIHVSDFSCGTDDGIRLDLGDYEFNEYSWSGNIAHDWETGKCEQTITTNKLTAGQQYYLQVTNFLDSRVSMPSSSSALGSTSYNILISH